MGLVQLGTALPIGLALTSNLTRPLILPLRSDQNVFIIPAKRLVIARHAMPSLDGSDWDLRAFLDPIVAAFPDVL